MVVEYAEPSITDASLLARSRKRRPVTEFACEYVFRPLAHPVVLVLLRLRAAPPAVVLANTVAGLAAAASLARGHLVVAALLIQLKTVLDNADGQLARLSRRVSVLGRYLDSESDLAVNLVLLAALGYFTGRPWLAFATFVALTLVLSANFNLERLYRAERGDGFDPEPPAKDGAAAILARVYAILYAPHDRLIERFVEWRLHRLGGDAIGRLVYHDRRTVGILANFGLSTQLAVLGVCLAIGRPTLYCWFVLGCGFALLLLGIARELRVRRNRIHPDNVESRT
jgi:archaetidylinositol phosphate synthase